MFSEIQVLFLANIAPELNAKIREFDKHLSLFELNPQY